MDFHRLFEKKKQYLNRLAITLNIAGMNSALQGQKHRDINIRFPNIFLYYENHDRLQFLWAIS